MKVSSAEQVIKGKDQRDYYYFMALGHYKLEVGDVWRWEVCGGGRCVEVGYVWRWKVCGGGRCGKMGGVWRWVMCGGG